RVKCKVRLLIVAVQAFLGVCGSVPVLPQPLKETRLLFQVIQVGDTLALVAETEQAPGVALAEIVHVEIDEVDQAGEIAAVALPAVVVAAVLAIRARILVASVIPVTVAITGV